MPPHYLQQEITTCICVQNNQAYFPFMQRPKVANLKTRWSICQSVAQIIHRILVYFTHQYLRAKNVQRDWCRKTLLMCKTEVKPLVMPVAGLEFDLPEREDFDPGLEPETFAAESSRLTSDWSSSILVTTIT